MRKQLMRDMKRFNATFEVWDGAFWDWLVRLGIIEDAN